MAHSYNYQKADTRGVPSLVWREGQNRRLTMIVEAAGQCLTPDSHVFVDGCGMGLYVQALKSITPHVVGLDIEATHAAKSYQHSSLINIGAGEYLPYPTNCFDMILSHEVIEHVEDDVKSLSEMIRVLKPKGRAIIFCPNRLYPFETHGHYWQGEYHFGNTPLINYLPNPLRNQLAPHVRAYTRRNLRNLAKNLPTIIINHTQIYPGYDNIVARRPSLGRVLRSITYTLEQTPLRIFGLSHLLVLEKQ
ncbi:MAG: class I SAM-dependent methyltransferase [Chloroflexota bacterium]